MNTLIVGGTSGLGLEIGILFEKTGSHIYATGRSNKATKKGFTTIQLAVNEKVADLQEWLEEIVSSLPHIDMLVYAAGFFEQGHIDELSDEHILQMINVGLIAPALILKKLLTKQSGLAGFVAITSTSQWTPREKEPLYAAVKSGLAMLARSVSLDKRVKKTLVVGPAGMDSNFWAGTGKDVSGMLSPAWVAQEILALWDGQYTYRLARILREPARTEVLETRS